MLHLLHFTPGDNIDNFVQSVRGAYAVLGMMLLGFGHRRSRLVQARLEISEFRLHRQVRGVAAGTTLALCVVIKDPVQQKGLWLAALLPMAANTVAYATLFGSEAEQASLAVLLSTLVSPLLIAFAF